MVYLALWADFGYLSLVAALEHATLHCARFIYAKNSHLIYGTDTGRSGLVGCVLLLPIVLPMKFEFFRTKVREVRRVPEIDLVYGLFSNSAIVLYMRFTISLELNIASRQGREINDANLDLDTRFSCRQ